MLFQPNKKSVSVILERIKPKMEKAGDDAMAKYEQADSAEAPDEMNSCEECAQAIIDAMQNKDAKMLAQALSDFLEVHKAEPEADEPEEQMSEAKSEG